MHNKILKRFFTTMVVGLIAIIIPGKVQAEETEDAVILYTNDVHCAIDDYSYLAAYAAQLETEGYEVVIIDAGDAIQGEIIGTQTEGLRSLIL